MTTQTLSSKRKKHYVIQLPTIINNQMGNQIYLAEWTEVEVSVHCILHVLQGADTSAGGDDGAV